MINDPLKASVMGILNVTDDSFFDGGLYLDQKKALNKITSMIQAGVSAIDIGAESSRPGSTSVPFEQEVKRLKNILDLTTQENISTLISIDTYKGKVLKQIQCYPIDIVNDIYALRHDPLMVDVLKDMDCQIVLMHMQGNPQNMQDNPKYCDILKDLKHFFDERIDFALKNGIKESRLIVDPGIGFGKTISDNLTILRNIDFFKQWGRPVMIGHSRKSFLGALTGQPVENRLISSLATSIFLYLSQVSWIRVHDVAETMEAFKVFEVLK